MSATAKQLPIESDRRFISLFREYMRKCIKLFDLADRCDQQRAFNSLFFSSLLSLVTSPLYVISMSMQMSVMPNITIYGDVSPKEINKGLLSEKIGIGNLVNRKAIATSEKQLAKVAPNMPPAMVKGGVTKDLMKASG